MSITWRSSARLLSRKRPAAFNVVADGVDACINATILQQQDELGCIKPGAHADLLVVEGGPLKDIELMAASGRNLRLIMRAGEIIRNDLVWPPPRPT